MHRERQSQAEQAEHGQQRRNVKAKTVGHDEDGHELQRDLEHLEDEPAQALRQPRVRRDAPRDAHDEPDDEHADHERDGGGDELFEREIAEAEADGAVHVLDAVFRGFERVLIGVRIQMAVSPFVRDLLSSIRHAPPVFNTFRRARQSLNYEYKYFTFEESML